jgi:hypothetical protein
MHVARPIDSVLSILDLNIPHSGVFRATLRRSNKCWR